MTVTGDLVTVDGTVVGVQGSGNADTIRLTLDETWDGYAKTAMWWDAHGAEAASRTLTTDLLEDIAESTRCYLVPVPPEALKYGGSCTLVLDGYIEGRRARTMSQVFSVAYAPVRRAVSEEVTTPTEMEQMQAQVESLVAAESARVAAEEARATAEATRDEAETDRAGAEEERAAAETERAEAETKRTTAETARANAEAQRVTQMAEIVERTGDAIDAAERVETVEAAIHSRRRTIVGTATDVEKLLPGDELIIVDDSSAVVATDYQTMLLEAQKAAAGTANNLETLAVLSAVNGTNLRRTAEGLLWTTDTVADFRAKLTAFAGAAVAGGYVDSDGACVATWAQTQTWLLEGTLLDPVNAELKEYPWRRVIPKTEYDAIKARLSAIELMLKFVAGDIGTLVEGGTL